ncbi:transposase [Streptoalloteichus tenebrarius]
MAVRRHELADEQWQAIEPLLPAPASKGRPRVDEASV